MMHSHPNYRGYDAIIGKAESLGDDAAIARRAAWQARHDGELPPELRVIKGAITRRAAGAERFKFHRQINNLFAWCEANGATLYVSKFPYQLAKIYHPHWRIVIYQPSKKHRWLRAVAEGDWFDTETMHAARSAIEKVLRDV